MGAFMRVSDIKSGELIGYGTREACELNPDDKSRPFVCVDVEGLDLGALVVEESGEKPLAKQDPVKLKEIDDRKKEQAARADQMKTRQEALQALLGKSLTAAEIKLAVETLLELLIPDTGSAKDLVRFAIDSKQPNQET